MKKFLLSLVMVATMALSAPTALFAADTLVDANGNAVQDNACSAPAINTASVETETEWHPATAWELLEDTLLTTAAAVDGSMVFENDTQTAAGDLNLITADTAANTTVIDGNDAGIVQTKVNTSSIGVKRHSNTSGTVSAYAHFNKKATTVKCTISLQEKYNGSWRSATNLPVRIYIKTKTNATSITAARTFTLKKGKVYRAKIYVMDKNSSGTYYKTLYTGAF